MKGSQLLFEKCLRFFLLLPSMGLRCKQKQIQNLNFTILGARGLHRDLIDKETEWQDEGRAFVTSLANCSAAHLRGPAWHRQRSAHRGLSSFRNSGPTDVSGNRSESQICTDTVTSTSCLVNTVKV